MSVSQCLDGRRGACACFSALVWVVLALALLAASRPAHAQTAAEAASKPPFNIAVLVSSRVDQCFDNGNVGAIRRLAAIEQDRINRQGGVLGRQVAVQFFDDVRDPLRSIANVRSVLADPQTVALVGLSNSSIAKATFDALGKEIKDSEIPFLSDISVTSIYEKIPNVFTSRSSQDDERLPVLAQFVRQQDARKPAFVGIKDALFSNSLADGLVRVLGDRKLVVDQRLRLKDDKLDTADIAAMVADLKVNSPDLLFLSIGSARTADVLKAMMAAAVAPRVFLSGRIEALPADVLKKYPNDIFQLAWDGLPELYNDRLRRLIGRTAPETWMFEGRKVSEAPGWKNGTCKERPETIGPPDPLQSDNLRAIGVGMQFADMVGLVAAAAKSARIGTEAPQLRTHIANELLTTYADGRGIYKGSFANWSFEPQARAAARTPLIVMLPKGLGRTQLAPVQYVRLKGESLRSLSTLYLDIDMIRAHRVDDNEKTFFAEFYLSMHDADKASIDKLEFTNAFLDPKSNERQITVRILHNGGPSSAYPESMKIYQVTGKFLFDPQLSSYPFDTQRFSIDLQPKHGDSPFIVQPPPSSLRDKTVATDGWDVKDQFVGYDEDFVPVLDAFSHEPSIVPFYKASYVWMMKREVTDYYLRVVIPLAVILLVAYLSIFIPLDHFEAIITLQVTALLSAVALYLALPKLDAGTATLSDRIFLLQYALVTLMIGISILRIARIVRKRRWIQHVLGFIHVVIVPAIVAVVAVVVWRASLLEG